MPDWKFYGRADELRALMRILERRRWFFVNMTGRRRIGKTTLVKEALAKAEGRRVFYVQVPDSGEAGVLSAVGDALEIFGISGLEHPRPRSLLDFARLIERLADEGYTVVLDEFQYFNRKPLIEFCSFLQAAIDRLSDRADRVAGGLIVLGSIHGEMMALLEDRSAPLYNRTTETFELRHFDLAAILAILRDHADLSPERLLFLWSLFEGVPKFYRDCFEQQTFGVGRRELLRRMFFESSSPLRTEADNWFLRELRGRYDMILKFVARHPGRMHGELIAEIQGLSASKEQIGVYLSMLEHNFRLIERKNPIFARPNARQGRYYLGDNFLQAWLGALSVPVGSRDFRPLDELVTLADDRLAIVEGFAFERLVGKLHEERSAKGLGDFPLTSRINGFWDRGGTEIDLVAVNETEGRIRFGSCKRSAGKLVADANDLRMHVDRFLQLSPGYRSWRVELAGFAPRLDAEARARLQSNGITPLDLDDLTNGLI